MAGPKDRFKMRPLAFAAFALFVMLFSLATSPAVAQDRVNISFDPGRSGTTINGTIIGDEYIDYALRVGGGQQLNVSLTVTGTNGNGTAYFNILPAGKDFPALFVGSNEGNTASVTIPSTGDWAIRVYLMGNDRDAGKTVGYSIDVYIPPSAGSGGGSSSSGGSGMLPEEDFFVVNLSTANGRLNVRDAPRANAGKLGEYRNGTVVQNIGGCVMSDGEQWCNVQPSQGGVRGWVSARFLSLPRPGGGNAAVTPPAPGGGGAVVRVTGVAANDVLNVRSGPGTGNRVVGALANGDSVRQLGCRNVGNATWCEIEMMTDMRERGWVNARFLTGSGEQATQLPSANRMERISFATGSTGTEFPVQLTPGASVTYILGARNGQFLDLDLPGGTSGLVYRIFNPDGSLLLGEMPSSQPYRGQLWQSGDHKIEVTNRSNATQYFNVLVGVR